MTDAVSSAPRRALVLGGGGIAGIAWHLGVLTELLEGGVDVDRADYVLGTSAGSVAGGILRFGQAPAVFAAQAAEAAAAGQAAEGAAAQAAEAAAAGQAAEGAAAQAAEGAVSTAGPAGSAGADEADASASPVPAGAAPADADMADFGEQVAAVVAGATDPQDARARLGRAALAHAMGAPSPLLATLGAQFPAEYGWPPAPLGVCVVRADSGDFAVLDSGSGVVLSQAIAASCSVPLVFPPVEIDGVAYVDGGARSATNADRVEGYDRVLVLSCGPEDPASPLGPQLDEAVAGLREAGAEVLVVTADEASLAAFGGNSLDDASRVPSALAGRAQGARQLTEVAAFWRP